MPIPTRFFCAALPLVCLGLAIARAFFGISLGDESFYLALPYRFALGDLPFVDEKNFLQTSALLLTPFVRGYLALAGSIEGLMLVSRLAYLAFAFSLGAVTFFATRRSLPVIAATIVALLAPLLVPFSIANFSYNTMGAAFLTAGLFLGWSSARRPARAVAAGFLHGLAVLCYPPLGLAIAVFAACLLMRDGRRSLGYLPAAAAPILWLLLRHDPVDVIDSFVFTAVRYDAVPAEAKLFSIARDLYYWGPSKPALLLGSAALLVLGPYVPAARALVLALPAFCFVTGDSSLAQMEFIAQIALLAPFLLMLCRGKPGAISLMGLVWLPSIVAGVMTAYASSNASRAAGLGMLPAAMVSCCLAVWIIEAQNLRARRLAPVFPLLVLGTLVFYHQTIVYRDGRRATLTREVERGPFRWLRTTPERAAWLETLQEDLRRVENERGKILFADGFPAGYLMSAMRPATPTVWGCWEIAPRLFHCADRYRLDFDPANVVVRIGSVLDPELDRFVRAKHGVVTRGAEYTIYGSGLTQGLEMTYAF